MGKCLCSKKANTLVACYFSGYKKCKKMIVCIQMEAQLRIVMLCYRHSKCHFLVIYFFPHTSHTHSNILTHSLTCIITFSSQNNNTSFVCVFITFNIVSVYSMYPLLHLLETLHTTVIHTTFFFLKWEREGPINCLTRDLFFPSTHFLCHL